MTTAAEHDPYLLPTPHPDSPVILPERIYPTNEHPNSRFRDSVWSLAPLIDNPASSLPSLRWNHCPPPLRDQLKQITWTMLNGQLRPTLVAARPGGRRRTRLSAQTMDDVWREWTHLARFLDDHGVGDLARCSPQLWRDYAAARWSTSTRRYEATKVLNALTSLWAFDQLSAHPVGISEPPWERDGVDDYLPAATIDSGGGENSTEPIDPRVIGPLLVWSLRMVEDFADDILAAFSVYQRLFQRAHATSSTPAGLASLRAYLQQLARGDEPLPATWHHGKPTFASTYVAALTGTNPKQVSREVRAMGLHTEASMRPGPCPLPVTASATINGRPWRHHIDFDEVSMLMRHLTAAAAVVVLYLTGMRPQEAKSLRTGCCPDPEAPNGRHLIRGRHYKNVTDDDGHHLSAGAVRDTPWVAITPVVHAIRLLERLVPEGELLFSANHLDFPRPRGYQGALKAGSLAGRIDDFIAWANQEADRHHLVDQVIPADPYGAVSPVRFRRTLAWHIARRPGGLIALAIQYGHMRTLLDAHASSGYGARERRGIHAVLDVETALAAAETAARLRDRITAGEKISGPAARRALVAIEHAPRFEGRQIPPHFARKAAAYLTRDGTVLFDNPDAHLICVFKRDTALCDPSPGSTAPRTYDCRPGCGNAVRTDTHADQLRLRAAEIDQLATHLPAPVARRLRDNAQRLRAAADTHHATAHLPKGPA